MSAPKLFFEEHDQYVLADNRRNRAWVPVTAESLTVKHETIAPTWLVDQARILDLGSCIGATGHWCLSHGAQHYVGVEAQPEYVDISNRLLAQDWAADRFQIYCQDIESFLDETKIQFDLVFACGVLYASLDYFGLLKKISQVVSRCVIIDTTYPNRMYNIDDSFIEILDRQVINKSTDTEHYVGLGSRPTPQALTLMMSNLGFQNKEGLLYPRQISSDDCHDAYHSKAMKPGGLLMPARFLVRFFKTATQAKTASDALLDDDRSKTLSSFSPYPTFPKMSPWVFDEQVAKRFQTEAETHIPDYHRVIDLSMDIVEDTFSQDRSINLVDVGSALGYTIDRFVGRGYTNVQGVEISSSMKSHSLHQDRVLISDHLPNQNYHAVLANWTLHFILDRVKYLQDIFDRLDPKGLLILTDKMTQSPAMRNMYHSWKLSNGVTQSEIDIKENRLKGVLVTQSLSWYVGVLESMGFQQIEVANSRFNFNTLICRKP